jgi:membrane associated rhomboid family serine protease
MGLYDREYVRGSQPGFHLSKPQTAVMQIVVITVGVYLLQVLVGPSVTELLALPANWITQPWRFFELLTYGFVHDANNIGHILINMFVFWMFGRELEARYGKHQFVAFYLTAIVFAGLAWAALEWLASGPAAINPATGQAYWSTVVGASGGISAIVVLFAMNFPHRQILFMMFLPMPMWLFAVLAVLMDVNGAMSRSGSVAFTAHLAGALYGYLYYRYGWAPASRMIEAIARLKTNLPQPGRPKLRVHNPDRGTPDAADDPLAEQVDQILAKIQAQGQDSLTRSERRVLEKASRRYQQRRD